VLVSRSITNLLFTSELVQRNNSVHYNCNFRTVQTSDMLANKKENRSIKIHQVILSCSPDSISVDSCRVIGEKNVKLYQQFREHRNTNS
jgi:hypothetical protein